MDSSEGAARVRLHALNTLRDLELSGPFRRLVHSVNDPLKGEAIISLKEAFRKDLSESERVYA